jgi:hypothetical protein
MRLGLNIIVGRDDVRQYGKRKFQMLLKLCRLLSPLTAALAIGQETTPPPPLPPSPPRFMVMKGLALSCFAKPAFEEDGMEFFVCNGGGGLAGVRKKNDPSHTVLVRDADIAQNLNMQEARGQCAGERFSVCSKADGILFFCCGEKEMNNKGRFKSASKSEWKRYNTHLNN